MGNQVATIEDHVYSVIPQATELAKITGMNIDAEKNYAIQQLYKNEMAITTAQKNPVSVQNAILNLSSIGISLNPALKHAYLVPRDGGICLDISYMGLMHLAQLSGSIEWGQAKIVYANDTYENQGLNKEPLHKYSAFGDRGQKVGVYCTVKLASGDFLTEEMSAAQVEDVKQTSKAKNSKYSPWATFEDEMWRKTVVKRASKYWPKVGESFREAVEVINEHEGIDNQDAERADAVKKLHEIASNGSPVELWYFLERYRRKDEELYLWLYRQFPAGKKVEYKKKFEDGQKMVSDYIDIFNSEDEAAIEEAKDELNERELKIIFHVMGVKS